jgi:MFS family permease
MQISARRVAPGALAWIVWCVGLLAYIVAVVNRTSLSAVGVQAADRFLAEASVLSLFAVIQLAVYGGMQIPIGLLLDRFGARPVMVIGMFVMACGQFAMAFSTSIAVALVARVLLGAGDAAIFPGLVRLIALWFPAQRAPMLTQATGMVGQTGQLLALLPLAALLKASSWTVTFGSIAGLTVLFGILSWMLIRNRPAELNQDVSIDTSTGVIRVVTSAIDLRVGVGAAWSHPGTRLAFWSHFTTVFLGMSFALLWGMPFLTAGAQLSVGDAGILLTLLVLTGILFSPILGELSRRFPTQRSAVIVLPVVIFQLIAWLTVMVWPGVPPLVLLVVLMVALGTGGPASMIAFDHARTYNPAHRLSAATGLVNSGGYMASLIATFVIGITLDLQTGGGSISNHSLDAYQNAFLAPLPLWAIGVAFILIERRKTRIRLGLHRPRN